MLNVNTTNIIGIVGRSLTKNTTTLPLSLSAIIIWNFGMMGMFSIYWKAPLVLQQVGILRFKSLLKALFVRTFLFCQVSESVKINATYILRISCS